MLASKLKQLTHQINPIAVIFLACLSLIPLASVTTAGYNQKVEMFVVVICFSVWSVRQLAYFISALIRHQDTLFLWSLHTFSRVESSYEKTWGSTFFHLFRQKHFLVLGNKQSGKSALLKNAGATEQQAPFEYQQKGLITHSVWSFERHALLESTALMPHNDETVNLQTKYWRHLIGLNKWHHTANGFDGIIVVVSIQNILNEQKSHPTQSLNSLRSQIKNITNGSQNVPIFIVLSGLDYLPGFRTFFRHIDKEDIDKPLGFLVPRSLQYSSDMQTELDKVANDIEMYLIYQLEKVIQGTQNDVEKMHVFHESFKSLKPKLVQLLFGFTTHVQNPILSILFTAHCDRDVQSEISNTHQVDRFYQNSTKHYFSRNVLDTICNHITWQPSVKLYQYALLIIGLLAWNVSELSVANTILTPLQESIHLLFDHKTTLSQDAQLLSDQSKTPIKKPVLTQRMHTTTSPVKNTDISNAEVSTSDSHEAKHESPDASSNSSKLSAQIALWDMAKQSIDQKLDNCDIISHASCLSLAGVLSNIRQTSTLSLEDVSKISHSDIRFREQIQTLQARTVNLDQDQLAEVDYMLAKLKNHQPKITFSAASWQLLNRLFPEFSKLSFKKKIEASSNMVTKTCRTLGTVAKALPFDSMTLPECNQQLNNEVMHQLYAKKLKQYQTALENYHSETTVETFLKKSIYLHDNTHIIDKSMQSITQDLLDLSQHEHLQGTSDYRKLQSVLDQAQSFDEKTYKQVLKKIIVLSKEIQESKNKDLAALQALDNLIAAQNDRSFWPKPWSDLDAFSRNCVLSFEKVVIKQAGQFLNTAWDKHIAGPYAKRLKPYYPFDEHSINDCALDEFDAFFSSKGVVSMFINKYLSSLVDIHQNSGAKWKSLHGKPLPFHHDVPHFIMGANIMQKMFYPNNSPALWFEGVLRYRHGKENIQSVEIVQDGNKQVIQTKQTKPIHIKWPHANEYFEIAVNLTSGERSVLLKEQGAWSMVRLLNRTSNDDQSRRSHLLNLRNLDLSLDLEFESQNIVTPLSSKMQNFFQVPDKIYN